MRLSSHRFDRPGRARLWVASLVLVEAILLVGAAGWFGVLIARGAAQAGPTAVLIVLALALALVLAMAARASLRGGRSGRGLIITWQLLQGATALTLLGAPAARPGAVAVLVLSVGVLAGIAVAGPTSEDASVTQGR